MKLRVARKIARAPLCPSCGCCWKHRRGTRARAWRRLKRAGLTPGLWLLPGVFVGAGGALVSSAGASWADTFSSHVTWVFDSIPLS